MLDPRRALFSGLVMALLAQLPTGSGAGLLADQVASADTTRPPRARTWEDPLIQFTEEDRERLDGRTSYEVPEVYELASVIVSLSPYGVERTRDSEYRERVRARFASFADHPIVQVLGADTEEDILRMYELRDNAFTYCFDDANDQPHRLYHCQPFSHVLGRLANLVVDNLELLEDFAIRSDFRSFYAENRAYYDSLTTRFNESARVTDMKRWLEARFSNRVNNYRIVFSPLTDGWHINQRFTDGDFTVVTMFVEAGLGASDWGLARMAFTEVSHNYVNPVSARFFERLDGPESFGDGDTSFWVDRETLGPGYQDGFSVFNEYMTWAVFELWARDFYPDRDDEIMDAVTRQMVERRGFIRYRAFADALTELYDERSGARGAPTSIESLYPDLLDRAESFRSRSERDEP